MTITSRIYLMLCWAIAIFILIAYPMPAFSGTKITYYDKVLHLFLYGGLAYLIMYAFEASQCYKKYPQALFFIFVFLLSSGYAVFGEWVQSYVPGRTVSIYDSLAGIAGVILFLFIFYGRQARK